MYDCENDVKVIKHLILDEADKRELARILFKLHNERFSEELDENGEYVDDVYTRLEIIVDIDHGDNCVVSPVTSLWDTEITINSLSEDKNAPVYTESIRLNSQLYNAIRSDRAEGNHANTEAMFIDQIQEAGSRIQVAKIIEGLNKLKAAVDTIPELKEENSDRPMLYEEFWRYTYTMLVQNFHGDRYLAAMPDFTWLCVAESLCDDCLGEWFDSYTQKDNMFDIMLGCGGDVMITDMYNDLAAAIAPHVDRIFTELGGNEETRTLTRRKMLDTLRGEQK